ncbi:histidine kinase [Gilvimarinus sp. F26214L]|uniref:histidine kinase n=1 Tax=Gilvimarinus sp. DZF01 TaxID=3461371 RepID=UPI004045A062
MATSQPPGSDDSGDSSDSDDPSDHDDPPAPPEAPSVSLTPQPIKSFLFSWDAVDGATQYRLLENPDGQSGFVEVAILEEGTAEYRHEVFLPSRVSASYILQACNDVDCTDSAPVMVDGSLAEAAGYIKASNTHMIGDGFTDVADDFGHAVALSADGSTLAVGAYGEDGAGAGVNGDQHDHSAMGNGAVYVFRREAGVWQQHAYLKASVPANTYRFGYSLALSADGRTLAVGAERDHTAVRESGSVYVFVLDESGWREEALLKTSNADVGDYFGTALALSSDGNRLAASSPREDSDGNDNSDNSVSNSGAVYIFDRVDGSWTEQALLKAPNPDAEDHFGSSLALSVDGLVLGVTARGEDSDARGVDDTEKLADNSAEDSGAAYVFEFDAESGWAFKNYLKASNSEAGDQFGSSLALSGDGQTMVVGATLEDSSATGVDGDQTYNSAVYSGAAYVFVRNADGWQQQAYLKASNSQNNDHFGSAVALSDDGSTLVIGAPDEDGATTGLNGDEYDDQSNMNSGAVYGFVRSDGVWQQFSYVKASNTGGWDYFGGALALSADATTLAVGAKGEDSAATGIGGDQEDNGAEKSGAVYLY